MTYCNFNLFLLGVFLIVNLALGLWAGKGITTIKDYVLADKKFSVGALVITYLATEVGDDTIFRSPFEFFSHGIGYLLVCAGVIASFFLRAYLIAPFMQRFKDCLTLSDIMQKLYGGYAKVFTGLISSIYSLVVSGFQICCMGVILQKFLGIETQWGMVASGVILIIYSAFGGIRAVTATDVFQFVMAVGTLLFISAVAVNKAGGLESLIHKLPLDKLQVGNNTRMPYYLSVFIMAFVFFMEMCEPCRFQRILMCNNTSNIKRTFIALGLSEVVITLVVVLLSFSATVLCPDANPNEVIPTLCHKILPGGAQGILAIGFLAIFLSTGDSYLHSAGVSFSYDFLSPIYRKFFKNFNEVQWAKLSTVFLGILAILFALFEGYTIRLDYIFASLGLFIIAPLLLGIWGLISRPIVYLSSCIASILAFIYCSYQSPLIKEFTIPICITASAIAFLITHFFSNGKFVIADLPEFNDRNSLTADIRIFFKKLKSASSLFCDISSLCKEEVKRSGSNYSLFGIMYIIILVLPYFLWSSDVYAEHENIVLYLRLIGVFMCSILMAEGRLPNILKDYLPVFWYITLTYCLPFLSIVTVLITNGAIEYIVNTALTIMFLLVIVSPFSAIGIGIVGSVAAILFYKFFIKTEVFSSQFTFDTIYLLVYQIIFGTVIGLLFARRKQQKVESIEEARQFATQRYDMAKDRLYSRELTAASTMRDAMGDSNIGIMKKLEKVRSAVDRLVSNAELDEANISETEGWLDELQQSILSNIFQGKKFLKLHVEDLNLTALTTDLAKLCKKEFEGTTIINLNARSTNIQCDKEALFRILTRALHELKEDISLAGNTPSDTTITLEITDTTIKYLMSSRPNYEKNLPAIRFILTSADALDPSLLPDFYEKEIEDPFELKDYSGAAENVTVNNYIKAHYAATVTTAEENGSTKTFAFPREIYDIRPEGFDKVYYEDRKNFRYDPAALGLELYFLGEIRTIAKKTNHAKAQKAVDFIRKYHYNQTYRTGESFYVHSIQATRILLRLMKYQLDISKSKDAAEIERDVLTSSRIKSTYLELQENQETLIITSLLQHLIDRTAVSDSLIETIFGYEIAIYLNFLSNLGRSEVLHQLSEEDLVKSITASRNPTLLCIKLADRLHDLHTIDYVQDVEERKKFAAETSRYFVEVANFLGFHTLEIDIASACTYILTHGKLKGFEFRSEAMLFLM